MKVHSSHISQFTILWNLRASKQEILGFSMLQLPNQLYVLCCLQVPSNLFSWLVLSESITTLISSWQIPSFFRVDACNCISRPSIPRGTLSSCLEGKVNPKVRSRSMVNEISCFPLSILLQGQLSFLVISRVVLVVLVIWHSYWLCLVG